jgi:hypothetical protein
MERRPDVWYDTELNVLLKLRAALNIDPRAMRLMVWQLNQLKRRIDDDNCSTITLVIQQGRRHRTLEPYLNEYDKLMKLK